MIHKVMKLAVRMKLHTNGNEQVESFYYARNIKSAVKGIDYLYNNSISPMHVFFENNSIVFEATPLKLGHCILL